MDTEPLSQNIRLIQEEFNLISCFLDERRIRLWCAARAKTWNTAYGRGGITAVSKATGVSRPRIYRGLGEIESEAGPEKERIRKPGGGRKKITEKQPGILRALEYLIEPVTGGDPEPPLRWTCKSTYQLRDELVSQGYGISQPQVGKLLGSLGYSLQSARKTEEGGDHCDRDAQFRHISEKVASFQKRGLPTIPVDTKKKRTSATIKTEERNITEKDSLKE